MRSPRTIGRIAAAVLVGATCTLASTAPLAGQDADPDDVSSIDAIIEAYYDVISGPAGEMVDVERDRSLHHPEAWVSIANVDAEGRPTVRVMTLDDYHAGNEETPRAAPFYEWETSREVRRTGNVVHVWSDYASSREPDGEPFTTGTNTITLWWDGSRWWVMGWMFDQSAGTG